METSRHPEVVNLRIRDSNNVSNIVPFTTGEDGKGYATLFGSWSGEILMDFLSNESGTEFRLDVFVPITKMTELYSRVACNNRGGFIKFEQVLRSRIPTKGSRRSKKHAPRRGMISEERLYNRMNRHC